MGLKVKGNKMGRKDLVKEKYNVKKLKFQNQTKIILFPNQKSSMLFCHKLVSYTEMTVLYPRFHRV